MARSRTVRSPPVVVTGRCAARPRAPSRRRPVPTASSPPTAGSTTPSPPGSTPTCSSATSTRSVGGRARLGRRRTSPIERHPADKAATDTELALALRRGDAARHALVLVAGRGDRLDHAIAALGALGAERWPTSPRSRGGGAPTTCSSAAPDGPVHVDRPAGHDVLAARRSTGRAAA